MSEDRPLFILAGNGPYENRGCEAIVRGTVEILRTYFDDPEFVCASFFNNYEQFELQKNNEFDPNIKHIAINIYDNTYKRNNPLCYPRYVATRISKWLDSKILYNDISKYLLTTKCVLSIGGDNYQLNGANLPRNFILLDNYVIKNKIPLFIWGASVGPFSIKQSYENFMAEHLSKVNMIFARESETIDYLSRIGVNNVVQVADPAFIMKPIKPTQKDFNNIPRYSIGLNFSPLMALYVTNGDLHRWRNMVIKIISKIYDELGCPIFLIPHVTIPGDYNNDYWFMKSIIPDLQQGCDVELVSDIYNAQELKWIISSMKLFIGSRMHSTIASLSSYIPTISLGYSIKSIGINKDIFGHQKYCISPVNNYEEIVIKKIIEVYNNSDSIKKHLSQKIPGLQNLAYSSGEKLSNILINNSIYNLN